MTKHAAKEPVVRLGDTHFQLSPEDPHIAFSTEAIANDKRMPEMWQALIEKLESEPLELDAD